MAHVTKAHMLPAALLLIAGGRTTKLKLDIADEPLHDLPQLVRTLRSSFVYWSVYDGRARLADF